MHLAISTAPKTPLGLCVLIFYNGDGGPKDNFWAFNYLLVSYFCSKEHNASTKTAQFLSNIVDKISGLVSTEV